MKLKRSHFAGALAGLAGLLFATITAAENLWEGETVVVVDDYPFLAKLMVVDPAAPLVVFTPGRNSTARVAYGGHEGYKPEDFFAHHLSQMGYNFLGVSYPVLTEKPYVTEAYPDFTIRDWGNGLAQVTKKMRDENGLTGPVIHSAWSMGGKSVQPFAEKAKELGFELDFAVSLAATPPLPAVEGNMDANWPMHEKGLMQLPGGGKGAVAMLRYNDTANGHTIIPPQAIANEYLGHSPVALMNIGLHYDAASNSFVRDHWANLEDAKFYDYGSFPIVATIAPSSKADARHASTDKAMWGVYNSIGTYIRVSEEPDFKDLPEPKFDALKEIMDDMPDELHTVVDGNHFFFIGEKAARQVAEAIVRMDATIGELKEEITAVLATN